MKKGLILEGGAMRGMFTAGVIDVMMEHGIEFDGAIGVSAGAAFGCNYKSKQIGRVLRYNTRFCRDKRYGGFRVLLKEGNFYSKEFCYEIVPMQYDIFDYDTYERNPMAFYVVATDVDTGKAEYHKYEGRLAHRSDGTGSRKTAPGVRDWPSDCTGKTCRDSKVLTSATRFQLTITPNRYPHWQQIIF